MDIRDVAPERSFARHETFHLRYGWLKKCHDFVDKGNSFNDEDAPVKLGVGKNMAKSIRFWGMATKIIKSSGGAGGSLEVTDFGKKIFGSKGMDPYLEHPETAWVLHWALLSKPTLLPVWWCILNKMTLTRMRVIDMTESAEVEVNRVEGWENIRPSSIKKDVDVFMHTYAIGKSAKTATEDYLDSPLRSTDFLQRETTDGQFRFASGKKPGMTPELVAYICLDFIRLRKTTSSTISTNMLATELGGPGQTLRLNEYELGEILHVTVSRYPDLIGMRDVNGAQHISFKNIDKSTLQMLSMVYSPVEKITMRVKTTRGTR